MATKPVRDRSSPKTDQIASLSVATTALTTPTTAVHDGGDEDQQQQLQQQRRCPQHLEVSECSSSHGQTPHRRWRPLKRSCTAYDKANATATTKTTTATTVPRGSPVPHSSPSQSERTTLLSGQDDTAAVPAVAIASSTAGSASNSQVFSPSTSSIGVASTSSTATYYLEKHQQQQQQQQQRKYFFRSPALSLLQSAAKSLLDDATPSTAATPSSIAAKDVAGDDDDDLAAVHSGSFHTNSSFDSSAYLSTWRTPSATTSAATTAVRSPCTWRTNNGDASSCKDSLAGSAVSDGSFWNRRQNGYTATPSTPFRGPIYDSPYSLASSSYDEQDAASSASAQHNRPYSTVSLARTPSSVAATSPAQHSTLHTGTNSVTGHSEVTATTFTNHSSASSKFNQSTLSHLSSLCVEKMPALPNEQDRKRFLGCLAAILASSYDFDEPDENEVKFTQRYGGNSIHEQEVYLDMAEQQSYSFEENNTAGNDDLDSTGANPHRGNKQHTKSVSKSTLKDGATPQTGWNTKSVKAKAFLAQQRHRRRRYHVLSKLLIQSSDLLLLENSVGKAFIPMLAKVLVPEAKNRKEKDANNRQSTSRATDTAVSAVPSSIAEAAKDDKSDDSQSGLGSSFESLSDLRDLPSEFAEDDVLMPFLESLLPGAGIRCLSLFLLQHLLSSDAGYDARIRHVIKKLGVLVLARDMQHDPVENTIELDQSQPATNIVLPGDDDVKPKRNKPGGQADYDTLLVRASRKFEALEHSIARRIILLSESTVKATKAQVDRKGVDASKDAKSGGFTRDQIVRGVKIGAAGIAAGTLFAVTGGMAAGAIAMSVSALAGTTATVAVLTSPAIVTTIFGVGGGGLTAYKMQRRTQGLTEFEFRKETNGRHEMEVDQFEDGEGTSGVNKRPSESNSLDVSKKRMEAELFSVICISGWLTDSYDYQRPWGVQPTSPKLTSRLELLERFYAVHSPEHVPKCAKILACWKDEEEKLWDVLRQKYGTDPSHLFPIENGPRDRWGLTLEQEELLDGLFVELGLNSAAPEDGSEVEKQANPLDRLRAGWKNRPKNRFGRRNTGTKKCKGERDDGSIGRDSGSGGHGSKDSADRLSGVSGVSHKLSNVDLESKRGRGTTGSDYPTTLPDIESSVSTEWESVSSADLDDSQKAELKKKKKLPKHIATVWDFKATYGGELYTVRWESRLLKTICDCVMDLAIDVMSGATKQLLKQTVLNGLLTAIALPASLLNVANMIDGDWTLAIERADEAGKELARTLLFSKAGRRPVTLVGFSFGGRIIYCCLKELARAQEDWEDHQVLKRMKKEGALTEEDEKRLAKMNKKFDGAREPASIVEDVVLMGLPNHLSLPSWKACRQVVSGRFVNCYSTKDLILSLMFQVKRLSAGNFESKQGVLKPVCGTCAVAVPGVENFNVTDLVSGHEDYCVMAGKILERIRLGHPLRSRSLSETGPDAVGMAVMAAPSDDADMQARPASRKLEYS